MYIPGGFNPLLRAALLSPDGQAQANLNLSLKGRQRRLNLCCVYLYALVYMCIGTLYIVVRVSTFSDKVRKTCVMVIISLVWYTLWAGGWALWASAGADTYMYM